eukprot:m.19926 g.19926  ORF g.19926 m.19926 type:complete len:374 (+) comp5502_c0_seq2:220-1341(+)
MSWPSSLWLTCMVSVIFGHVHSLDAGHCEAENADCTDTIPANSTPRSCLRLIMAGDAHAAALCFSRCVALETESTCPNENAFVVTAAEVGATQQVDRALVQPLLKQIPLERWAARETPLAAIKAIRPVLGLLHHPADVVVFLREYMLALWAAECYAAYTSAFILSNQTQPDWWAHPLQIPPSKNINEPVPMAWHEPSAYAASAALEAAFEIIAAEVLGLEDSSKYVMNQEDETLVGKGAWSELRLYDQYSDVWNATNCARLPKTCSVLRTIPSFSEVLPELESPDDRIPGVVSVFRLHPGSSLVPHTGPTAMRTTLHLGIEVPSGTEITVGGETRGWTVGRVLAFDDSFIHSVRNRNPTKPRTVLLANVWKRR